jgi:TrpR-related protein YerC/YecD
MHTTQMQALYEAVASLKTAEECALFFQDICTIKEVQSMAQRWEVAKELDAGRNYNEIYADTGVSSATISRVNRCLMYGDGGYRIVLDRMKEETDGN